MDEDMEIEEVFVVHEVDLGYEYDAPRFFDFTREETQDEAHELERWFESANSYPPSPFAVKLLRGDNIHLATFNVSPKSKNPNASVHAGCAGDTGEHQAIQPNGIDCDGIANGIFYNLESGRLLEVAKQHLSKGSGFQSGISSDKLKKKVIKDKPRSSTLMKPTASMLAKQFQPSEFISSRLQTQPGLVNRVLVTSGSEVQAGKRQKLEKGHMCKPVEANHQNILVHKAPKKKRKKFNLRKLEIHLPMNLTIIVFEGCFDTDGIEKISHSKLRLTIPREPDLKTAQRSTRMRPPNNNQMEDSAVSVRRFKARPLNRKILESSQLPLHQKSTPKLPEFKLFHLKTLERSAHSSSSVVPQQSSLIQSDNAKKELFEANNALSVAESMNKGAGRTSTAETRTQHGSQFLFQAHPLNRRVLSSKGDVGVLRNDKHGTTAPTKFKFQSDKSSQQIPPTDLFSMLSLSSGKDNGPCSKIKSFRHLCTHSKVSKENRCSPFQPKQTLVSD